MSTRTGSNEPNTLSSATETGGQRDLSLTLIHSANLVTGGRVADDAWVLFGGDTVLASGVWTSLDESLRRVVGERRPEHVVDAKGLWLTPGFIDIHCHGGGGGSFHEGNENWHQQDLRPGRALFCSVPLFHRPTTTKGQA